MDQTRMTRFFKVGTISLLLLYFLLALVLGTLTFCDALRGFEIWKQFSAGADWNTLNYPSVHGEFRYYISWWSPAQWLLPYFLKLIFTGASVQLLQFLLIFFCLIGSLIGYKKLFQQFGFSEQIVWISLFCLVSNQVFYWHTLMYYGGDLLMLAFFPYFMLILLKISKKLSFNKVLLFVFILLVGIFLKNTFVVLGTCSICFLFFYYEGDKLVDRFRLTFVYCLTFLAIYLVSERYHLSRGETPGRAHDYEGFSGIKEDLIGDLTYSFGSPVGTFSRYTPILQKLNPDLQLKFPWINVLQLVPFLLTFLFLYKCFKKNDAYSKVLIYFTVPFFAVFTLLNLQDRAVGYEMRHFAPLAFLYFPGIVGWLLSSARKIPVYLLICSFCLLDLALFAQSLNKIEQTHGYWNDYKLPKEDVEIFQAISSWERQHPGALLLVEEYWQLSFAAQKADKLVLEKIGDRLFVASGMELEFPNEVTSMEHISERYQQFMFILKKDGKISIEKDLGIKSYRLIKSTSNYKLYLSNPK